MKQQTRELIVEFSKSNKVGREKLERFVEFMLEIEAPDQPAMQPSESKLRGPKTTDESLRIREQLMDMQESLKGKLFTSKEIAQQLNAEPTYVTNNLRWLADNMGIVKLVGRKDRPEGGRGRKENIWAIAQ